MFVYNVGGGEECWEKCTKFIHNHGVKCHLEKFKNWAKFNSTIHLFILSTNQVQKKIRKLVESLIEKKPLIFISNCIPKPLSQLPWKGK